MIKSKTKKVEQKVALPSELKKRASGVRKRVKTVKQQLSSEDILELAKKTLDDTFCKMMAPVKQPMVRKMKYRLVANPASVNDMPKRSIRILGAVVLVPTSIPTWHMIPMNDNKINGLPNKDTHSIKPEALSGCSSVPNIRSTVP